MSNDAIDLVRNYLAAMERRDLAAAQAMLAPGFVMTFPGGKRFARLGELVDWAKHRYRSALKEYERFDVVLTTEGGIVYCYGTLRGELLDGTPYSGVRFIDRFTVAGGMLADQMVWNDMAEVLSRPGTD